MQLRNLSAHSVRRIKTVVQLSILVGFAAARLFAQSNSSVCQVSHALRSPLASPPPNLACDVSSSCYAFIDCAMKQDVKESFHHKGDSDWHEHLVLSISAVLGELPHPTPPKYADYYREFFVIVSLADRAPDTNRPSDTICTAANVQLMHFGPLLRMLPVTDTEMTLDSTQEFQIENARIQYTHCGCYDKDLLDRVTSPPPEHEEVKVLMARIKRLEITSDHPSTKQ
jgi:hypothetical protein